MSTKTKQNKKTKRQNNRNEGLAVYGSGKKREENTNSHHFHSSKLFPTLLTALPLSEIIVGTEKLLLVMRLQDFAPVEPKISIQL